MNTKDRTAIWMLLCPGEEAALLVKMMRHKDQRRGKDARYRCLFLLSVTSLTVNLQSYLMSLKCFDLSDVFVHPLAKVP